MRALAENWESVESRLSNAQAAWLRVLIRRYSAPDADRVDRLDALEELVDVLSGLLPANHPVRRAIADDDSTRYTSVRADDRTLDAVFRRLLESPPSGLGAIHGAVDDIEREVSVRLFSAPALREKEIRAKPDDPGLIRLDREVGPTYPAFQFDRVGRPVEVVLEVNRLLDARRDPWGVADWWLGLNTWLGRSPASALGLLPDRVIYAAAVALATGV